MTQCICDLVLLKDSQMLCNKEFYPSWQQRIHSSQTWWVYSHQQKSSHFTQVSQYWSNEESTPPSSSNEESTPPFSSNDEFTPSSQQWNISSSQWMKSSTFQQQRHFTSHRNENVCSSRHQRPHSSQKWKACSSCQQWLHSSQKWKACLSRHQRLHSSKQRRVPRHKGS